VNLDLFLALRSSSRASTPAEQSVLLALAGYADKDGVAWPSIATLAKGARLGESTVRAALRALERVGHIECVELGGGRFSTRYRVTTASHPVLVVVPPQPLRGSAIEGVSHWPPPPQPLVGTPSAIGPNEPMMKQRRTSTRVSALEASFSQFWNAYPRSRRKGKVEALAAWKKLAPDAVLAAEIVASVAAHAKTRDWTKDNGEFIPWPQKFLNKRRWEDEITAPVAAGVREIPDATAWRRDCQHEPPCQHPYEHEERNREAIRVTA
jgi:hypothetical protein